MKEEKKISPFVLNSEWTWVKGHLMTFVLIFHYFQLLTQTRMS
jgi:hypothetical protein